MSQVDVAWLIGAGFVVLTGQFLGNALQSYGAKLSSPVGTFAQASSTADNYAVIWGIGKLADASIVCVCWWLVSFALALGRDDSLMAGVSLYSLIGIRDDSGGYALMFYSFCLALAACSIVTEAMADYSTVLSMHSTHRVTLLVYLLAVFPIIFHWAWSDHGWASPFRSASKSSLLAGCGVIDTAGSGVVHLSAGVAAGAVQTLLDFSRWHR